MHPLRLWREENNYSQAELSVDLGCRQADISLVESYQKLPGARVCVALEEITGGEITPAILVREYGAYLPTEGDPT